MFIKKLPKKVISPGSFIPRSFLKRNLVIGSGPPKFASKISVLNDDLESLLKPRLSRLYESEIEYLS